MWQGALDAATSMDLPISFDLNHRPQLGPLDELWSWVAPYVKHFRMIILSVGQIEGLAEIEGYPGELPSSLDANDDEPWRDVMRFFQQKWGGPAVACCFKRRSADNVQRRWACIVNDIGAVSSMDEPVWHIPKEETGGGSAWASGFIYGLLDSSTDSYADPRSAEMRHALRSADVLSALCQETVGDHSTVRLPGALPQLLACMHACTRRLSLRWRIVAHRRARSALTRRSRASEFEAKMAEFPVGSEVFVGGLGPADVPAELRSPSAKL